MIDRLYNKPARLFEEKGQIQISKDAISKLQKHIRKKKKQKKKQYRDDDDDEFFDECCGSRIY